MRHPWPRGPRRWAPSRSSRICRVIMKQGRGAEAVAVTLCGSREAPLGQLEITGQQSAFGRGSGVGSLATVRVLDTVRKGFRCVCRRQSSKAC